MMSKRIDKLDTSKKLLIARLGLSVAVERVYDELKEDPDGPEVSLSSMIALAEDVFDNTLMPGLKALVDGDLPDVTEDDLVEPEPEPEPVNDFPGYKVFTTAACDDWMSYRDSDTSESVKQRKCLFRTMASYHQLPQGGFTIVWINAAGKREFLHVSSSQVGNIAMGDINAGYRKYRWVDDKFPHPVAYAPRYFDAVECKVLVKE